jgi:hypothetical protein
MEGVHNTAVAVQCSATYAAKQPLFYVSCRAVYKYLIKPIRVATRRLLHVQMICLGIHALQDNVPEEFKAIYNNKMVSPLEAKHNHFLKRSII